MNILNDTTNVENSFDVKMIDYDYTIGKVIEYLLNELFFKKKKYYLMWVLLKNIHTIIILLLDLYLIMSDTSNIENIKMLLNTCADESVEIFDNIRQTFV